MNPSLTIRLLGHAFLIDEIARLVYVQSHGKFAVLDADSGDRWLSVADLFSGRPSRFVTPGLELIEVYDIGNDAVEGVPAEVFLLETKPARDQKVWVDSGHGLVVKARWQNTTYQLVDVQTDLRVPDDRFALDLRDNTIPELAEMQISRWWPNTRLLGITDELLLTAETKPPSVFTAARRGDLQILKELVSEENLDQKDSRGLTSLWIAAAYGKTNIVDFLLSKGADLKVKAQISGLTPLHIAALNGQKDVVELLLAKGVDINARTTAGETPLRLALRRGYKEVAALLREHGAKE